MTATVGTRDRRRAGAALPAGGPPGTGPPGDDAAALFREARRRRHRRWSAAVCGLVLALVATLIGLEVSGGGPGRPPQKASTGGSPRVHAGAGPNAEAGLAGFIPPAVEVMGQADTQLVWAAGISGLYITSDGGAQWRTVTPPNLANEYVAERVITMEAVGQNDLWLVLYDVPGLVPYSESEDGSDRGEGIDRSTDGGLTWTFSTLPGCLQLCGPTALSFVDADHGFAAVSADDGNPNGRPALLFATQDGGATWQVVATPPDLGGVEMGGPAPDPKLVFTNAQDGWAVSGPLEGANATTANPGGVLYRTTDGGHAWSVVPGLPSGGLSLPTFFGSQDGVVLRDPAPPSRVTPVVDVTRDGGVTWSRVSLPAAALGFSKGGGLLAQRFSAVSPTHWFLADGTKLYVTSDGGRHWTVVVPRPAFAVSSDVFTSSRDGLAVGQAVRCTVAATRSHPFPPSCYPMLVMTTDGGRHWGDARI